MLWGEDESSGGAYQSEIFPRRVRRNGGYLGDGLALWFGEDRSWFPGIVIEMEG